jgi:hypothetical protein
MWEGPRAGSAPSEAWGEVGNADRTDPDRAAFLGAVHSVIAALSRAQTPHALIMLDAGVRKRGTGRQPGSLALPSRASRIPLPSAREE